MDTPPPNDDPNHVGSLADDWARVLGVLGVWKTLLFVASCIALAVPLTMVHNRWVDLLSLPTWLVACALVGKSLVRSSQ